MKWCPSIIRVSILLCNLAALFPDDQICTGATAWRQSQSATLLDTCAYITWSSSWLTWWMLSNCFTPALQQANCRKETRGGQIYSLPSNKSFCRDYLCGNSLVLTSTEESKLLKAISHQFHSTRRKFGWQIVISWDDGGYNAHIYIYWI